MAGFWSQFLGVARDPVPEHLVDAAVVPGMAAAVRFWGDSPLPDGDVRGPEIAARLRAAGYDGTHLHWLAVSGGGSQGAFGAGLLKGWTAAGDRPIFQAVTGISTGALTAPLALLGSDWDEPLEEIYTLFATRDVMRKRNLLKALAGDAFADSTPLQALIERYADERLLKAIAAEYDKGRQLLVGTTNLDTMRPVVWRMSEIAASGHPDALRLFRRILLASASIPAALPPVPIEVEVDGRRYDELHVDGGATKQVIVYPIAQDMRAVLGAAGFTADVHIIRNGRLTTDWQPVERRLPSIAGRAIASLIRVQGFGDLYRIFLATQRDGVDFNLAYIPADFIARAKEQFDLAYMRQLFDRGYEMAAAGYPWEKRPPGFAPD